MLAVELIAIGEQPYRLKRRMLPYFVKIQEMFNPKTCIQRHWEFTHFSYEV